MGKMLPIQNHQRRFGDETQTRKRRNTPLPQVTHEEPFDAKLWWLAALLSWVVVGLIFFGIKALFVP